MVEPTVTESEVRFTSLVFHERAALAWGCMWRWVLLSAAFTTAVVFVVKMIQAVGGAGVDTVPSFLVLWCLGVVSQFLGFWFMLRWVLAAQFGPNRLRLMRREAEEPQD